ncbi:MAG: UDP-N-acetylmuramoyl-tripeptide--D-alanyl-D-alanine ligase, partial [Bacteroidales bacterium]
MTPIDRLYNLYLQHPVVTTDTRNCPAGSLFFALKGEKFNANEFAASALQNGASYAVIDQPEFASDQRYIVVENVLETLQQLAAHHRSLLNIPIIGITGTNGKTTTKELTHAVLSTRYNTLATEGNLNNHIGVPLTLLKIRPSHEIAIIEMGANHPGEIDFLCNIAKPDFGLITNVGKAHLEGFGSFEGIIKTKTELYASLRKTDGTVFIHSENTFLTPYTVGMKTIPYSTECKDRHPHDAPVTTCGCLDSCNPCVSFLLQVQDEKIRIQTNLIGSYNLMNLVAAAAIGNHFQIPEEAIAAALTAYEPANKRSQLIQTKNNTLILDAYNANPT